ncbi:unnamed protein product [Rotaria socialis]|uniref:Guanylate cyclase domain-containing protein n=1 Tax=Rotaria socialis TaxID=392032 RepID=A0A817SU11_9BILA|nr:unnamed protein product [Rotaria socialis]CAF3457519.1 unnamed protein product [Rotaria socialis]CAF3549281.1 unnamed protein product [Rotaria socialis]CAF4244990.1 unnamed protein product [Rotaria socialis]CAF4393273.1 unnamed protein product [Rotaria socialis]
MVNGDCQSISRALLDNDSQHLNNGIIKQSTSSLSTKSSTNNVQRILRSTMSNASLSRYRSSFRRGRINSGPVNSQCISPSSFPLFRHFYLMRNAFTRRRTRELPNKINESDGLESTKKIHSSSRIEISHVLTTIFITIASAGLLIFMIFLDLAYLNDAMPNPSNQPIISPSTKNNTSVCFRHPKVCVMKGLVIIVFIGITVTLCYTILTLYIRARRHSRLLERKTDELEKEKCLTEKLLHEILPPCVAKDLINGRKAPAEYYESVTVYFSDIVGFTIIASMCSPNETCDMLNRLYSIFDSLLENFDVYKVETIGDAYMVVSGAPKRNGDKHPNEIANMSLALLRCKQQVRVPRTSAQLQLRIGIHTGPVCAAVIGSKMPRYCMFGDTVNVANRMESSGLPERIHLSSDTYACLINRDQYTFEDRGEIAVKGKGHMRTYFLLDRKPIQHVSKSRSNTLTKPERESL